MHSDKTLLLKCINNNPTKHIHHHKNIIASVPTGSEASLFSNHPNLLVREAYPSAKIRKNSDI